MVVSLYSPMGVMGIREEEVTARPWRMIRVFIPARGQEPAFMHIFNHNESGKYPHRVDMCPCDPVVDPLNEGEGYVVVHRSLDRPAFTYWVSWYDQNGKPRWMQAPQCADKDEALKRLRHIHGDSAVERLIGITEIEPQP
jgi:hypothetical protein